jgi:cysteine desulfurase / selenocysteine lyase
MNKYNEKEINDFANKFRSDFPGLNSQLDGSPVVYLDNAATTLKPQVMISAVTEYYQGISSNVHRGKSYALEMVSNRYEQCRYKIAELINASGNEVVMLENTTAAINLVASGLNLQKSDLVIVLSDGHHSNILPWMRQAKVEFVRFDNNGVLDIGHYYELLKLSPKVVALNHCSNVTGVYHPIAEMTKAAKEVGAKVVVDAAQSIPHKKLDVNLLDIDFLAFSAHKMGGPTGMGILYGKKEMLELLEPLKLGGGVVDWVDKKGYQLRKIPHRFEAGTPHIAGAYGFSATIDYLNHVGFAELEKHDAAIGRFMLDMALNRPYIKVIGDLNAQRGAVLSMRINNVSELDYMAKILSDSYGIVCRHGYLCAQPFVTEQSGSQVLRISSYLYNTTDEVRYFFQSLDEIGHLFF